MTGPEAEEFILLKRKIEDLLNDYKLALSELDKVRSENQQLQNRLGTNECELAELKKEIGKVRLSGAILGDGDNSQEARKRINDLVREINNCIALLNNI
ncbi:MAG TPA: hypothetical protein VMW76_06630 [Bacteroidales bacterium]|nr:hypothetical protein [Bacteroidales bacterium]